VRDVRLLRLSEKTSGANAAVVGFGPTRRILLGDTLEGLEETRAVLAHELGHQAHRDLLRGLGLEAVASAVTIAGAAALLAVLPSAIGHGGAGDPAALPAFALALGVVGVPVGVATAWHSRRRERAADAYAARLADPAAFGRALERLVASNLSELDPPRLERLLASHPAPGERIQRARQEAAAARRTAVG
jgi:STE24 endopeptidase